MARFFVPFQSIEKKEKPRPEKSTKKDEKKDKSQVKEKSKEGI